jgi:hypothetical protein
MKYKDDKRTDWVHMGQGKPEKSVIGRPEMKGRRWQIDPNAYPHQSFKKFNAKQQPLEEYEEIENGDTFDLSSKNKGDLDYLTSPDRATYRDYFDFGDEWPVNIQQPTKKTIDLDIDALTDRFSDVDNQKLVGPVREAGKKKPVPTNPSLWSRAKSAARAKFDIYPSAYANGWAAKWYKKHGGGWRMGKK